MNHTFATFVPAGRKARYLAACGLLLTGLAGNSQAAPFLDGHPFVWRETSDFYLNQGWTVFGTVGAESPFYGMYYTFDIRDTGLSLQFFSGHSFENTVPNLNGYNLQVDGAPWWNTGLQIDVVSSAWASFYNPDDLRLSYDNNSIHIDFGGLTVQPGDALVLSLTPLAAAAAVPEPAPGALLAAGLAALGWHMQRRRQTRAP